MVRFEDPTAIVGGESCNDNGDNDDAKQRDGNSIAGKKRPPSTPHPKDSDASKKRSPGNVIIDENHIDTETRSSIASLDIDSQNNLEQVSTIGNLESSRFDDRVECGNKGHPNIANESGNDNGTVQEEKRILNSSKSNKSTDNKKNESKYEPETLEEGISDNDNDDPSKYWEDFVDAVDTKAIPNLEAYIKAKDLRTEASSRFVNAMDSCIQALRDTTDGVLSDVVEPICNQYSELFKDTEESIIGTMASNHSRRKEFLELMQRADAAWSEKSIELTTEIMGGNHADQKFDIDSDATEEGGSEKGVKTNGDVATMGEAERQSHSKCMVSAENSPGSQNEKAGFGQKDPDWEDLLEYEPSRERILSFLDEREKRNHTMKTFGQSLDDIHSGLESEIEAILQISSNLFNQHEKLYLHSENEIEFFVMENYERRGNLQKELEKSAKHAQGLFANLLSRISQSI